MRKQEKELSQDIVYNTLGDIHDEPWEGINIETKEAFVENPNQIIKEFNASFLGCYKYAIHNKLGEIYEEGEYNYRLSDYLDKLPHGIFDKKVPGIGATTIEILSRRHSILVMPTKTLAYTKALKHLHCLYVGSAFEETRYTTKDDIIDYIRNKEITHKKFLVVADSLGRLIDVFKSLVIDVYNDYFLMIDEIDLFQEDSSYRPKLEDVIDYYFRFNVKKRCLVSATMREFSNPLFEKECRFDISKAFIRNRKINLIHSNNINKIVRDTILQYPNEKILIAYNSITEILNVISLLDDELKNECGIMCSDASQKETNGYYTKLNKDSTLSHRITFMTCTYFAGVDIEEKYHLITVSNMKKTYQTLSIDKMTQIYGRCRLDKGILSDTIIYNTMNYKYGGNINYYKDSLLKKADKVIALYQAADDLSKGDNDLMKLFDIVKEAIQEKASESMYGGKSLSLTRFNIEKEPVIAYFNIDYLIERKKLESGLYYDSKEFPNRLARAENLLSYHDLSEEKNEEQENLERINEVNQANNYDNEIKSIIDNIKILEQSNSLTEQSIQKLLWNTKKQVRIFCERFLRLYEHISASELCGFLWNIRYDNDKSFKGLNNTIMYWAMEDNHPFKLAIREAFKIGESYSPEIILENMNSIIHYHMHKKMEKNRVAVFLLKQFFKTERPRKDYKIVKEYPYDFINHNKRIPKEENNLRKYFMI